MNLIHRHIFANVALTCLATVGLFAFVLMIGNTLKEILPYILSGQFDVGVSIQLILLLIPYVLVYALPLGILTGVLLVLGRMSSDREVTALRASGLSVAWLSAPILFFALLCVAFGVFVNLQFMPMAKVTSQRMVAEAVSSNPLSFIIPKTFIRDFPGMVIYAGEKDGSKLKDLWLWELDEQRRVRRFGRAESGEIELDATGDKLTLTVERAQMEVRNDKDPENFIQEIGTPSMERATFDLPLNKLSGDKVVKRKLKWMTFSQLIDEWRRLGKPDPAVDNEKRELERMRVQIVFHEKFAMSFAVLSFALVAIPLGIKVSRKETSANLFVGVGLFLGYYFLTIVVGWFDGRPELRPDLLMWAPNLIFQGLGLWMFYKIDRS
ncbi:LptF/LptG family permease [Oleiharenicola lentus]|uniref:LptF/LptG family permease n=1 Tax=Oleiharenicola lentus TaxID=2508720 RepID=UPI003F66416C